MKNKNASILKLFLVLMPVVQGCAETSGDCPVECQGSLKCCEGFCVDVNNNDANCGYCGNPCGEGGKCQSGSCVETCGDAGAVCLSNQECCDDVCVDTNYNAAYCGDCDTQCGDGEVCSGGVCETLECDPECESGETCCKVGTTNSCVDLDSDRNNCGTCGNACGLNEVCRDGACSADECEPPCTGGMRCCGGTCVDSQSDPENCGFCGKVCDEIKSDGCTAGQCSCRGALECRSDQQCCEGIGCRNVKTDPSNCGECGLQCAIGESCAEGECSCGTGPRCEETESCCAGVCLNTDADPLNCGGCTLTCGDSGPDCVGGVCMCGSSPACEWSGGFMVCMGEDYSTFQKCCDGVCTPMSDDNCNTCGNECPVDTVCQGIFMFACLFTCG